MSGKREREQRRRLREETPLVWAGVAADGSLISEQIIQERDARWFEEHPGVSVRLRLPYDEERSPGIAGSSRCRRILWVPAPDGKRQRMRYDWLVVAGDAAARQWKEWSRDFADGWTVAYAYRGTIFELHLLNLGRQTDEGGAA